MSFNTPLPAATNGIEFGRLTSEDVRKLSVKRIYATPTLDSMLGPTPGGVHDPALGAINVLDISCTTCRLNSNNCPGHCGHIELPIQCYHAQYMDTTLRLLRAKCVYCHRFRIPQNLTHQTICQLRLLEHGLIKEFQEITRYKLGSKRKRAKKEDMIDADDSEEDINDLMDRRERFVNKVIKKAEKKPTQLPFHKSPMAIQARKDVIMHFLQQVALVKKCTNCKGISPTYRKEKNIKIFRAPLNLRAREEMRLLDRKAANPLIYLMRERKEKEPSQKPMVNGDTDMDGDVEMTDKTHGAEEEIALNNALETTAEAKASEIEGTFEAQAYMTATEVHAALTLLFDREQQVVDLLFAPSPGRKHSHVSADIFFMTNVLVTPNKFRPLARQGAGQMMEAQMNSPLNRVINAANTVTTMMRNSRRDDTDLRKPTHAKLLQAGVALQEAVNELIDNPPAASGPQRDQGIKQVLEKKEGLFRMNMMGKRVNFAARSVISPDPNIETNEIGVPLVFARKLTFPEPVREGNLAQMQRLVINGNDKYPGAAAIENENGQVMSLRRKTLEQRQALAKQLSTPSTNAKGDVPKKVYRHLMTGDMVIMNRQPTLHKPSMMCHRARVLKNEKTIRMHYANCNTYNADFDGDEMNMHFPQSEMARAEASNIADTDHQYLSATAGKPLRGLIQDHISMGVQFTSRDVFFDRDQYQELLYNCIRPENGHLPSGRTRLITVSPAIIKPKQMWTGKQLITTVLKNIIPSELDGINLTSKSQTSADRWGEKTLSPAESGDWEVTAESVSHRDTEQVVIFRDGEHLCGILDKGQMGPAVGGLIHSCYELYGQTVAGQLLSVLGRLLTRYLNERAWSCGMDDLYLTPEGDNLRKQRLSVAPRVGHEVSVGYVQLDKEKTEQGSKQLISRLEDVLRNDDQLNTLDQLYNASTKSITDAVSKVLPAGLRKPFPRNQMQAMTTSGAKGSGVNANQISSNLGQQVLEGRRVPIMVSGKTLPLFRAFETDPKAGGYVSGRFLTGIQPHEYYFHAMSGREGLIDTAVKTAKSGYLQRCIIKGLEGLRTEYDNTVRESSNGSIFQFLYGEDGLEVTKQRHLKEFTFIIENQSVIINRLNAAEVTAYLRSKDRNVESLQKKIIKSRDKSEAMDPIISEYPPANYLGSTSESFATAVSEYVKNNPDGHIRAKGDDSNGLIGKTTFTRLMDLKYMQSVVDAGEAIGVVAAQSVGEPSTQMTLNTFHLAGHSAKNVTLGIPRLREIIMTASPNLMTPTMTIKPIEEVDERGAKAFAKGLSRLPIAHVINHMSVTEATNGDERTYKIEMEFWDPKEYCEEYAIKVTDVAHGLEYSFLERLDKMIRKEMKQKAAETALTTTSASHPEIGASVGTVEQERSQGQRTAEREGGEEDIDSDADPDDAKDAAARARRDDDYDEPDEDEARLQESSDENDDEDGLNDSQKVKKRKKLAQSLREQNPDDAASENESDSDMDTSDLDSEEEVKQKVRSEYVTNRFPSLKEYKFSTRKGRKARFIFSFPTSEPKILLLPIVEKAVHLSVVQHVPGITMAACFMEPVLDASDRPIKKTVTDPSTGETKTQDLKEAVITTSGVNLIALREMQHVINPHTIRTNSVHDMLRHYGVEAARNTIANEISAVFKGHGIAVDLRHIYLIADAMTHSGGYRPFSRHGIVKESGSVLNKMSFETVMGFIKDAVMFGETDELQGPSARIVAGRRGNMGTGSFDVLLAES